NAATARPIPSQSSTHRGAQRSVLLQGLSGRAMGLQGRLGRSGAPQVPQSIAALDPAALRFRPCCDTSSTPN
ncbi:hypothetical protein ABTA37_19820, partial [Acinetobacter baumannii]